MPTVKRLVCLANSRKLSGRCVAGRELAKSGPGSWIRPVSARATEEVSEHERQYEDGSDPQVLDIIDIPLDAPHPKTYQSENWLLDPKQYWAWAGRMTWQNLGPFAENPPVLWLNESSTGAGSYDRVAVAAAEQLDHSLYLLRLKQLRVRVFAPGAFFGNSKRRVQAMFAHRDVQYGLWVTDPVVERKYLAGKDGDYPIGECFATVSLGEPYEGYCYKLVAALITPDLDRGAGE